MRYSTVQYCLVQCTLRGEGDHALRWRDRGGGGGSLSLIKKIIAKWFVIAIDRTPHDVVRAKVDEVVEK